MSSYTVILLGFLVLAVTVTAGGLVVGDWEWGIITVAIFLVVVVSGSMVLFLPVIRDGLVTAVAWLLVVSSVDIGGTITVAIFLVVGVSGSIVSFFLSVMRFVA